MKQNHHPKKLVIKAIEIKGNCPVFKVGDKMVIEGPEVNLKETDKVCIHALFSLGTFIVALREGLSSDSLGLAKRGGQKAYFQCLDPGQPYTDGGTVTFEVSRKSS
ncbi:MAG: TIGR04076 family protein [Promethearchaeota archaeon]|nr:MAG: TIGR04076 family protein [Candidatus Lokiarchaeota archaeon]